MLSNRGLAEIKEAASICEKGGLTVSAIQRHYSLLTRSSETSGILNPCRENRIPFFSYRVQEPGARSGKYAPQASEPWKP